MQDHCKHARTFKCIMMQTSSDLRPDRGKERSKKRGNFGAPHFVSFASPAAALLFLSKLLLQTSPLHVLWALVLRVYVHPAARNSKAHLHLRNKVKLDVHPSGQSCPYTANRARLCKCRHPKQLYIHLKVHHGNPREASQKPHRGPSGAPPGPSRALVGPLWVPGEPLWVSPWSPWGPPRCAGLGGDEVAHARCDGSELGGVYGGDGGAPRVFGGPPGGPLGVGEGEDLGEKAEETQESVVPRQGAGGPQPVLRAHVTQRHFPLGCKTLRKCSKRTGALFSQQRMQPLQRQHQQTH